MGDINLNLLPCKQIRILYLPVDGFIWKSTFQRSLAPMCYFVSTAIGVVLRFIPFRQDCVWLLQTI
jgi:hypothetical protein